MGGKDWRQAGKWRALMLELRLLGRLKSGKAAAVGGGDGFQAALGGG